MSFLDHPIGVPFGNANYDIALGGSHDQTYACPPNTEIQWIVDGTITDISSPSWGKQITVRMTNGPVNGHAYFAMLHFAAVNPALHVGQELKVNDVAGWSGGCVQSNQYNGTENPTGENFLNSPTMSSMPQIGIALCDGPAYGGIGWKKFPPIDMSLNPQPVIDAYLKLTAGPAKPDYQRMEFEKIFSSMVSGLDVHSGIANLAYQHYKDGKNRGPAMSHEFTQADWNGVEQVMQIFAMGVYHWNNGNGVWYPFNGAV